MINGIVTCEDGDNGDVVGFLGEDMECEGCGAKVTMCLETDDSVFLCEECFNACIEDSE